MPTFGPGTLRIGETGSAIDLSCRINSATISMSKDEGDSTTKLCGTVRPGKITYTYTLGGNLDIDSDDAEGFFALSQQAPGSEMPFEFTPDSISETTATGIVIIDPLDFGGEEFGDDMTSDFEWTMIGPPSYAFGPSSVAAAGGRFRRIVVNGRDSKPTDPEAAAAKFAAARAKSSTAKKSEPVPA